MSIDGSVILASLIYILPAYFANTVPVYINGIGRMDFGKNWFDGKPILGSHKTMGGLISAILGGGFLGISLYYYFPDPMQQFPIWIGFVHGFGAMLGDAIGSFAKRRIDLKPGGALPFFDQVGFVLIAYAISYPIASFNLIWILIVVPATLILHLIANFIAYSLGWKDVWW